MRTGRGIQMAYNNNSNSGYNRGYSGGGQSRPPQRSGYGAQQRTAYNQPLAEIQAEKVPDDYIDRADAIMREMSGQRPVITTNPEPPESRQRHL